MDTATKSKILEEINAGRIRKERGFCEIPTSFFVDRIDVNMAPLPPVAFYQLGKDGEFEEFRKPGEPYSALALSLRPTVWVREQDFNDVRNYAEHMLIEPSAHSGMPPEQRMESIRKSAMLVVEDLFENPSQENINRSVKVVGSFVHVLMKEPKAYLFLAKLSSHDPYTLQHSVGTAVHSIILGKKLGMTNEKELQDLGLGGLLHDVGKVKVKKEIINKNGPLDELEWEEMRQHSLEGYEIVKDKTSIADLTKRAILEHHENPDGSGYPHGLKRSDIHAYSRIVCICDVFNALTTNRSYSGARTPFDAFQFMREKLEHKVEEKLFRELVLIYGGKI